MELLKKFDAQNYKDTTSVFEKYTIRGIIVRDGKIAMPVSYTHLNLEAGNMLMFAHGFNIHFGCIVPPADAVSYTHL